MLAIPNIYEYININKNHLSMTNGNFKNIIIDNDNYTKKIKMYFGSEEKIVTLKDIINENEIIINETLENTNGFVYGQEVLDLHTLEYNSVFSLSVGAIKELDKQVKDLIQEVSYLKKELKQLKNK